MHDVLMGAFLIVLGLGLFAYCWRLARPALRPGASALERLPALRDACLLATFASIITVYPFSSSRVFYVPVLIALAWVALALATWVVRLSADRYSSRIRRETGNPNARSRLPWWVVGVIVLVVGLVVEVGGLYAFVRLWPDLARAYEPEITTAATPAFIAVPAAALTACAVQWVRWSAREKQIRRQAWRAAGLPDDEMSR